MPISTLEISDYLGENSIYHNACINLADSENQILKNALISYLNKKPRSHDDVLKFIDSYIEIMFYAE